MNTANLQIEGLLIGIAALLRGLERKGMLSAAEIEDMLSEAERAVKGDRLRPQELSPANVEAVLFPLRFLRVANAQAVDGAPMPAFAEIATKVGQAKEKSGR